jgi:hypothetical protein
VVGDPSLNLGSGVWAAGERCSSTGRTGPLVSGDLLISPEVPGPLKLQQPENSRDVFCLGHREGSPSPSLAAWA